MYSVIYIYIHVLGMPSSYFHGSSFYSYQFLVTLTSQKKQSKTSTLQYPGYTLDVAPNRGQACDAEPTFGGMAPVLLGV